MDFDDFKHYVGVDQGSDDKPVITLPAGVYNITVGQSNCYDSQVEAMQKSSKLYTPPPVQYEEPAEDLYDWDTGKVRQ